MPPNLDIVIVDYNAGALIQRCLESLRAHVPSHVNLNRIVVVDNASNPPTEIPALSGELRVVLLRNEHNQGFAKACNQGAALCSSEYLLLLNPDTELLANSLDLPVLFLENPANARYGLVSIQLLGDDGKVSQTCSEHPRVRHFVAKAFGLDRVAPTRMPTGVLSGWDHAESREVEGLIGAFFLVRRDVWDQLQGFDERFFVYFEEAEFGYRASKAGMHSFFLSTAQARHQGGGTTDAIRATRLYFSLQSRLRYAKKHFGPLDRLVVLLLTAVIEPGTRLLFDLVRRDWRGFGDTARGVLLLWRWLILHDEGPARRRTSLHAPIPMEINP